MRVLLDVKVVNPLAFGGGNVHRVAAQPRQPSRGVARVDPSHVGDRVVQPTKPPLRYRRGDGKYAARGSETVVVGEFAGWKGAVVVLPADGHVHSEWSWDAPNGSMERTCARAVDLGLPAVAFTEHADFTTWIVLASDLDEHRHLKAFATPDNCSLHRNWTWTRIWNAYNGAATSSRTFASSLGWSWANPIGTAVSPHGCSTPDSLTGCWVPCTVCRSASGSLKCRICTGSGQRRRSFGSI